VTTIPPSFAQHMLLLHGAAGQVWLDQLPGLVAFLAERWQLEIGKPFANLSYTYVAQARQANGTPVVLKVGVINPELLCEIAALAVYDGRGAARLLAADEDEGALLLERLEPGTALTQLQDDEQATAVAAEVMKQLWRPVPSGHYFPTTVRWAEGLKRLRMTFDGGSGPFPERLVAMAERLFAELLAQSDEPVLLHGDLHHENILSAGGQSWRAIDPKGLVGEPAYEVGSLLRNPMDRLLAAGNPVRLTERRIAVLSEVLGFEPQRIVAWAMAQAVLSGWWHWEDSGQGWESSFWLAELLSGLLSR
jgi:streptomycin 6-kinase